MPRPSRANRLFVGTVPTRADLLLIDREHWYRIPVSTVRNDWDWPPSWFAPWETMGASKSGQQRIRTLWQVTGADQATRSELLPAADNGARAGRRYWRLSLANPQPLASELVTARRRAPVFISSDVWLLAKAESINDLWINGPLEAKFWAGLKKRKIPAERQWPTYGANSEPAIFDFAVFCKDRDIDIEVDGDQHHNVPAISRRDARRDNASLMKGFSTLRFDSEQVRTNLARCLDDVEQVIYDNGGLEMGETLAPYQGVYAAKTQIPLFRLPRP